jgi:hypothetical protein
MHAGSDQLAAKRFTELRNARFRCRINRVERQPDQRNPTGNIQEDASAALPALLKGGKQGLGQQNRGGEIQIDHGVDIRIAGQFEPARAHIAGVVDQ